MKSDCQVFAHYLDYTPNILRIHRIHDYLHQELFRIIEKYNLQEADFSVLGFCVGKNLHTVYRLLSYLILCYLVLED